MKTNTNRVSVGRLAGALGALALVSSGGVAMAEGLLQAPVVKVAAAAPVKPAAPKTAEEIVKVASATLFPENFTAKLKMGQNKPGAPETFSELILYKKGNNQVRADYTAPASQAGQRVLRKDGQIWMFMPDTKRPIKLSPKQSFGGSEFNNNDLMRLNLEQDYVPTIASETDTHWVLDMKAKDRSVSYDVIKWTIEKKTLRSVRQEYYTLSGKLIKTLEFSEYKTYAGLERPSVFTMKSNLAEGVFSRMTYLEFAPGKTLPDSEFRSDALNKQ